MHRRVLLNQKRYTLVSLCLYRRAAESRGLAWSFNETLVVFCRSMQQGKMFFFIGITMAVIQGGYARRIKPDHQIQTVSVVNSFMHYWITSQFKFSCNFLGTLKGVNDYYSKACYIFFSYMCISGNYITYTSVPAHWNSMEFDTTLFWLIVVLLW